MLFQCYAEIVPPRARVSSFLRMPGNDPEVHHIQGIPSIPHGDFTLPQLRIVSRHPSLSVTIQMLRVPNVPKHTTTHHYIAYKTTAAMVLEELCSSWGLLTSSKCAGNVTYSLEMELDDGSRQGEYQSYLPYIRLSTFP